MARTHLQQTKQYKQVGECFGVSSVSDSHDFPTLFLLAAILSSGDRVAVSSFEGAHGSDGFSCLDVFRAKRT